MNKKYSLLIYVGCLFFALLTFFIIDGGNVRVVPSLIINNGKLTWGDDFYVTLRCEKGRARDDVSNLISRVIPLSKGSGVNNLDSVIDFRGGVEFSSDRLKKMTQDFYSSADSIYVDCVYKSAENINVLAFITVGDAVQSASFKLSKTGDDFKIIIESLSSATPFESLIKVWWSYSNRLDLDLPKYPTLLKKIMASFFDFKFFSINESAGLFVDWSSSVSSKNEVFNQLFLNSKSYVMLDDYEKYLSLFDDDEKRQSIKRLTNNSKLWLEYAKAIESRSLISITNMGKNAILHIKTSGGVFLDEYVVESQSGVYFSSDDSVRILSDFLLQLKKDKGSNDLTTYMTIGIYGMWVMFSFAYFIVFVVAFSILFSFVIYFKNRS